MLDIISTYLFDLEAAGRSGLTIISYRQHLKDLVQFLEFEGVRTFSQVSVNHLRAYLASLQRAGLRAGTIRTRSVIISCFFNWLIEEDILQENPMRRVRRPRKPRQRKEIFSAAELLAIFKAAECTRSPARNKAMLCILLDTGLRADELISLKREHYNPATSTFTIVGKGKRVRVVGLGRQCRQVFESYLQGVDGRVWNIERGGFRDMVRRVGEKAGVKANPHKFRHTFANLFLGAGGSLDSLQIILGHSDISTTMIYAAAGQEERALRSQIQHSPVDGLVA